MAMKKAFFFTIDALFAAILIILAIILATKFSISGVNHPQVYYYSSDIASCLSNIKVMELNDTYIKSQIVSGVIVNPDNSIIEQIGEFYVLNRSGDAENLSMIASGIIPDKFGMEILINGEKTLTSAKSPGSELVSSRRLISGIERYKPVRGATSKVFLEGIQRKMYSSYVYFGGFVGQGNVSGFIDDIPQQANLTGMSLELDSGADFYLSINNAGCNGLFPGGNESMVADFWDISSCNSSIIPGAKNNFTVTFPGNIRDSYIGGGSIKVDYYTDELRKNFSQTKSVEYMPDIRGLVNLYSSFFVPGQLQNITLYLHYNINTMNATNNTFYVTIANTTIFRDGNLSGEKTKILTTSNITTYLPLSSLDQATVPIRIGFENVTFGYIYEGNADVSLITDVSGSMLDQMGSDSGGTSRTCDDPNFNLSTTSRISVAKCMDRQFVTDILNISGNQVGLISFSSNTYTAQSVSPTTDFVILNSTITNYTASGATCTCCGINSARMMLTTGIANITLIGKNSNWKYNNYSLDSVPGPDPSGNEWYESEYSNETQWHNGTAILGSTNGYTYYPAVNKEIGSNLTGTPQYANLWEYFPGDVQGAPNDFTSAQLNSTGNTYGIGGADDGWDWDTQNGAGPFGNDDDIDYAGISGGRLELDSGTGSPVRNRCTNNDCTGAYGILINITQTLYDALDARGTATITFWYQWHEENSNPFEDPDEAWVKARWTSPTSGAHYLGTNADGYNTWSEHDGADNTADIIAVENPDVDNSGTFSQDISAWIEGPGMYYLEIGGKLRANDNAEWGYWRFDDIQLAITNATNAYYFRKNFTIDDLSLVQRGVLNVLSDERTSIYLNGILVDTDSSDHQAKYWNRHGIIIPGELFVLGSNVIAAELVNSNASAKFDLELIGLNDSRDKAMMVMTDGMATYYCSDFYDSTGSGTSGTSDSIDLEWAINSSCFAREKYGITVYAVGYSDNPDEETLQSIAECGGGIYRKSSNTSALKEFYQDVASSIVSASRHAQTVEVQGNMSESILYGDSYIELDYSPYQEPASFGEISIIQEVKNFDNCTFMVDIPPGIRIIDAKLTSYSGEHWTDLLVVNNNNVYNLSSFSQDYTSMGDPFVINLLSTTLTNGNNTFFLNTGDSPDNSSFCSYNNSFIYTALVQSSVTYSDILERAEGCTWFIEFDDGMNSSVAVPKEYSGTKTCYYRNDIITGGIDTYYDPEDTYDDAMYKLLDNLDFDNDGRIFVNIQESNLIVGAISVGKVPYPWGPAIAEVRVWR
ncbi:MAG: VWA domain-containing protein [Nanoarchaeota archaeon]|nr:VWA domain-containing protein [Nanoarchaeota archaeon]